MDLNRVESELKKRLVYPYRWGRKQSNSWDTNTNFIYKTYSLESLLKKIKYFNFTQELKDYTLNRWYNFWSAMAVEDLFSSHSNVVANKNRYDKLIDFHIDNIPFDHKTTIFPKGFNRSFQYAKSHQEELIQWLYENQSQEGRRHLKNRLFIVLYDSKSNQHWKMKSEILLLKVNIDNYIKNFNEKKLKKLCLYGNSILSDIIWVVK